MELWKPVLAIVPAGLLLGMVAGQVTRPVMLMKDDVRPWPESASAQAAEMAPWRPTYESRPQDLTPRGYSYRPALDYEAYSWPDQTDYSAELLADYERYEYDYSHDAAVPEPDTSLTRRATAELAANNARRVAAEAAAAASADIVRVEPVPDTDRHPTVILPPVPPPLASAGPSSPSPGVSNDSDMEE